MKLTQHPLVLSFGVSDCLKNEINELYVYDPNIVNTLLDISLKINIQSSKYDIMDKVIVDSLIDIIKDEDSEFMKYVDRHMYKIDRIEENLYE